MSTYKNILKTSNFIDNQWIDHGDGSQLEVREKYQSELMAAIPQASAAQIEQAIQAAQRGFSTIKRWSAGKRADHLNHLKILLEENREAFVDLIVAEAGKPIGYAQGEIDRCIITVATAATEAVRFGGETVPIDYGAGEGKTAFTKRFPIGVIACITPFNFPLNLVLHKVAPALAVGCSVIVKPAPQAPLSTLALAGLIEKAGYPAGVFNAVVCGIPAAEKLVTDSRVAMLSFTGSEKVGWYLKQIAGQKKVVLELGGNAAVVVDKTADLATAARAVAKGAYLYAGQVCISTQRIFVVADVYQEFSKLLLAEIHQIPTGDPHDTAVISGPLIDNQHLQRIHSWINEAVAGGANLLAGGKILDERRNLYEPTLLTNTTDKMKVNSEEAFGPVAVIESVPDFGQALQAVNASRYGLQAGVFTNTFAHVKQAHEELEVGGIIINNVPGFRVDSMPYGGIKNSGFGREGIKYTMEEMTEPRLMVY